MREKKEKNSSLNCDRARSVNLAKALLGCVAPLLLGRIRVRKKSCWTKHCGMSGLLRVSGGDRMGNPDRFNAAWIRNWRRAEGGKKGESTMGQIWHRILPSTSNRFRGDRKQRLSDTQICTKIIDGYQLVLQWHKIYGEVRLANDRGPVRERSGPYRYRLPKTTTHHHIL